MSMRPLRRTKTYRRFSTRQEISFSRHPSLLSERPKGATDLPLQTQRSKSVPALGNPDHVLGDAFSAMMPSRPTVRRLNASSVSPLDEPRSYRATLEITQRCSEGVYMPFPVKCCGKKLKSNCELRNFFGPALNLILCKGRLIFRDRPEAC